MAATIEPRKTLSASSTEFYSLDCQKWLDAAETLSGVTATASHADLTVGTPVVNSAAKIIDQVESPANKSISVQVDASSAASGEYYVQVRLTTSSGRIVPFNLPVTIV